MFHQKSSGLFCVIAFRKLIHINGEISNVPMDVFGRCLHDSLTQKRSARRPEVKEEKVS